MKTLDIDSQTLQRLSALAEQEHCSVDALLKRWLGAEAGTVPDSRRPVQQKSAKPQRLQDILFEQVSDAIITTDMHLRITSWNHAAAHIYGWSEAEALGYDVDTLLHTEWISASQAEAQHTLLQTGLWQGEVRQRDKFGRVLTILASVNWIKDAGGTRLGGITINRDITARKQAEDALRQSEQRLRSLVDSQTAYIIRTDMSGSITYANQPVLRDFGMTAQEILGRSSLETIVEEDWPQVWQAAMQCISTPGEPVQVMLRKITPAKQVFWSLWEFVALQDQTGTLTEVQCIGFNIDKQVRAEEALQRQNEFLLALHQTSLDLLNHREMNDLLQVVVERAAAILDAPFGELLLQEGDELVVRAFTPNMAFLRGDRIKRGSGLLTWQAYDTRAPVILDDYSAWALRNPLYEPVMLRAVADFPILLGKTCVGVLALGRSTPEQRFTPEEVRNGQLFSELIALALENHNLFNAALQEIAARRQTETDLRTSETRYRVISELISDYAYAYQVAPDGTLIHEWMTDSFERVTGYSWDEDDARGFYSLYHPDDMEKAQCDVQQVIAGQEVTGEYRIITKQGDTRWVRIYRRPIRDEAEQRVVRFYGIAQDITAQKAAEAAELEQTRLETILKREQEWNATIHHMMKVLSHELRNPLAAISTSADILRRYYMQLDEQRRIEKLMSIHSQILRMNQLIDDVVMVVRGAFNRVAFQPQRVNLARLCQVSLNEMQETLTTRHTLRFSSDGQVQQAQVDETLLSRILVNLLSNAIKYSPEDSEVRLELARAAQEIVIRVVDQGIGIPADDQQRIFETFFRARNALSVNGTGLGLSIVSDCVRLHNGSISVESVVGVGSTFIVRLPYIPA